MEPISSRCPEERTWKESSSFRSALVWMFGLLLILLVVHINSSSIIMMMVNAEPLTSTILSTNTQRNIPFVALIQDDNVRNEMEKESRVFTLAHENNLLHDTKRLSELMNRREMAKSVRATMKKRYSNASCLRREDSLSDAISNQNQPLEFVSSLSEPNSQFIVKFKPFHPQEEEAKLKNNKAQQQLSLYIKAGHALGYADTFALVSRTSDLVRHVGQDATQNIEYISEMEPRFKSDLNFAKIQELAMNQTRLHQDSPRLASGENEPFPKHMQVIVTLLPSIDAVIDELELEEATMVAQELKSLLGPYFEKKAISHFNLVDKERIEISFSPLEAFEISELLKSNPHVHFIERKPFFGLLNMRASSMMQSTGPHPSVAMSSTPFYDLGVLGSNQIVAVSGELFFEDQKSGTSNIFVHYYLSIPYNS